MERIKTLSLDLETYNTSILESVCISMVTGLDFSFSSPSGVI